VDPSQVVKTVMEAARSGDNDAALALFAEDCVLHMPEGTFRGRDGVQRLRGLRAKDGGPQLSAGEPEAVDDRHVLVPLTVNLEMDGSTQAVQVTGVWTVDEGLVTEVRAVPGGLRMALASLHRDDPT